MQRFIRLGFLAVLIAIIGSHAGFSQLKPIAQVSGKIKPGDVRVFLKDSVYIINKSYVVGGTLIIEPGTDVYFNNAGRLVDSTGGRIIADGNASALYTARPDLNPSATITNLLDPVQPVGSKNPLAYVGYSDMEYFLHGRDVSSPEDPTSLNGAYNESVLDFTATAAEPTVHATKQVDMFWVLLDTVDRKIKNLEYDANGDLNPVQANREVYVTYQEALMFMAARMNENPLNDINLTQLPWKRIGGKNPNVEAATIRFFGQPANNMSREWGHFVILPGARGAFFRNVSFEGFKKDTTVDNDQIYTLNNNDDYGGWANVNSSPDDDDWKAVNNSLRLASNGSGGVITTFSSRTWILDCVFRQNQARFRGGAVQFLEAPEGLPSIFPSYNELKNGTLGVVANPHPGVGVYPDFKNPNMTDSSGAYSRVNSIGVAAIDRMDEDRAVWPELLTDLERAAHDDGRLSVFLGRFRNNEFDQNEVVLANSEKVRIGSFDVQQDTDEAATPYGTGEYGDAAYGGAIYIGGSNSDHQMEVGFGVNNSIYVDADGSGAYDASELVTFDSEDSFIATGNTAENRQRLVASNGAYGGAIHIADYTSLIVAGYFNLNEAVALYWNSTKSLGGAIYHKNTFGRLQVRGGIARDEIAILNDQNNTEFSDNKAGYGGAIYVDGNTEKYASPIIGGSDVTLDTRDYGYDILFKDNIAGTKGGAIFSLRKPYIWGSGGISTGELIGYGGKYPVRFWNNSASNSGGAIQISIPGSVEEADRSVKIRRASFRDNSVGAGLTDSDREAVLGGGAIYTENGDLNLIQGVEFIDNEAHNGNGGAICQVHPATTGHRLFLTDLDVVDYDNSVGRVGIAKGYTSADDVFVWASGLNYPADARMLTRFIGNKTVTDDEAFRAERSGSGTTQKEGTLSDVNLWNPRGNSLTGLPENGIGLGGAIYVLDVANVDRSNRTDSIWFNRVRMQNNMAFTGAAIYSDNYNLKLIFNRSLITGNKASSQIGAMQNMITGAVSRTGDVIDLNEVSSDLAGAVIYGEVQGPLPNSIFNVAANSIYDNEARFLIRLPDAPNTKGDQVGLSGIGFGGTDTLRGNYWGATGVDLKLDIENVKVGSGSFTFPSAQTETFFVAGDGNTWLPFSNTWSLGDDDARKAGPVESIHIYDYDPVPMANVDGDQNTPDPSSIPEKLLQSGRIYDIYDKGTDVKTADYSKRRMSPIEDFAVGMPSEFRLYTDDTKLSYNKYIRRMVRDPFDVANPNYEFLNSMQGEYAADEEGNVYHPISQPLYLETMVNYDGLIERSNHDPETVNETVFFVINENTTDYIRVNLKQVSEEGDNWETFRTRLDLVPDRSNRNVNPLLRRTDEGLANFGVGANLYGKIANNALNEDLGTLPGRKYENAFDNLGNATNLFSNRPALPDDNITGTTRQATYFAGERYNSLPVNVGDVVRIISRTKLWKEGDVAAYEGGISFEVTQGVEEPEFTGDVITLQTDTLRIIRPSELQDRIDNGLADTIDVIELLNTVMVAEDRSYPVFNQEYSRHDDEELRGRDHILNITAVDSNNYYDPRAIFDRSSASFTYLTYQWNLRPGDGLNNWLMVDTLYQEEKDGANGYFSFNGTPVNPYVVPGGETVTVAALNYPPHWRTLDSLKETYGWDSDNDTLAQLIELFPDYFHAQSYSSENARYLQQDTIDLGANGSYFTGYEFKIFVADSIPNWLDWAASSETLTRDYTDGTVRDTIVIYEPSMRKCGENDEGALVASLTDKLRFQIDLNTDDELEDAWAAKVHNWNFRYGRTSYGFENVYIDGDGNREVVDSVIVEDELGNTEVILLQTRPVWLSGEYLNFYDSDDESDTFGNDFTLNGQLNVRIDAATANEILKPQNDHSGAMNLDTMMTIVVNDGHGGKVRIFQDLHINVAPQILPTLNGEFVLTNAVEDDKYNPQLTDSLRRIFVFDANFDDLHTFELLYDQTNIAKDPCYTEAGEWVGGTDFVGETPEWLNINKNSGLLYGTPGLNDAPKTITVSVLVTDENLLTTVQDFTMTVEATNHDPKFLETPPTDCYEAGETYTFDIEIEDVDLERLDPADELSYTVLSPASGITVQEISINGSIATITVSSNGTLVTDNNGRLTITIEVKDKAGATDVLTYKIQVSEPVNFVSDLRFQNNAGSFEILQWGISTGSDVTSGDSLDGSTSLIGTMDRKYCETELPPLPPAGIFDARWALSSREGMRRSIYPTNPQSTADTLVLKYIALMQPGGPTSVAYPLTVSWDMSEVPNIDDETRNPNNSTWHLIDGFSNGQIFAIDMATGQYKLSKSVNLDVVGDLVTLTILDAQVKSLVIKYDVRSTYSSIGDYLNSNGNGIVSVSPNPVEDNSLIKFNIENASNVEFVLYDNLGTRISTIHNGFFPAGDNRIDWKGINLSTGSYHLRMTADGVDTTYPIRVIK
jgi:predicted outer membrane repeat protein